MRVLLVDGPGVEGLDERRLRWAHAAGLEAGARRCPDEETLAGALGTDGVDGIVLAPGSPAAFASPDLAAAAGAASVPVVAVHSGNLRTAGVDPAGSPLGRACARVIQGRGPEGWRGALRHLAARLAWPFTTLPYGSPPDQVGDLWLPATPSPHPVAVLVHGGFWYQEWERDLMDGLALDLARRGRAAWNVEYRRLGAGGGWPATGEDVGRAVDHLAVLASVHGLDLARVALIGHSAGGQLALWAAARGDAEVRPALVVGLASLGDLAAARKERLGWGAVDALLAGVDDRRSALAGASPVARLPLEVPQLLVHAIDDALVPVDQSRRYAAAALAAGDQVDYRELPGGGHFSVLDPASEAWREVVGAMT